MKATLTFDLPEEQGEHIAALRGGEAISMLAEIDRHCRQTLKHGEPSEETRKALEEIRAMISTDFSDL